MSALRDRSGIERRVDKRNLDQDCDEIHRERDGIEATIFVGIDDPFNVILPAFDQVVVDEVDGAPRQ